MWWLVSTSLAVSPVLTSSTLATEGWDRLGEIETLSFTFVVEKEGEVRARRAWSWAPETGSVTRTVDGNALTFTFGAPADEAQIQADAQFVNDLFWLAPPLQWLWANSDQQLTQRGASVPLPIGEGTGRHVILAYAADGGGYTPGDAYDLYLDENDRIVAWTYRKDGAEEPTLSTTFTDYQQVGPLWIATDHANADGSFHVRFEDLSVTR
jgi:hypothetical protein